MTRQENLFYSQNRMAEKPPQENLKPWVYKKYSDAIADGSVSEFFVFHGTKPDIEAREAGYEWLRYACDFLEYPRGILAEYRKYAGLPAPA